MREPVVTQYLPSPASFDGFDVFLRHIRSLGHLTADEEDRLARRHHESGDIEAAGQLAIANLRHVVYLAKGFLGYGLPLPDLVQEGTIGLLKAIKHFDPNCGVRIMSYAAYWIRAEIQEYIVRNWRIVRRATTKGQRKLFFKKGQLDALSTARGQKDDAAIASEIGVRTAEVGEMRRRLGSGDVSIDVDKGDRHSWEPVDYCDPLSQLENAEMDHLESRLPLAIADLDERSRDIVNRRWLAEKPAGLAELAEEYDVSAERIRQIQNRALQRLRIALKDAKVPRSSSFLPFARDLRVV